ncbi:MAG: hypothetical protein QM778_17265 [Myxococcales bacterium]
MPEFAITKPFLVKDAPLTFQRLMPGGEGAQVEVHIWPDLRVLVWSVEKRNVVLTGNYDRGRVKWNQEPSPNASQTAHEIIGADVIDALQIFHRRCLDPRMWTSVRSALIQL